MPPNESTASGDPRVGQRLNELQLRFEFDRGNFKVFFDVENGRSIYCYITSDTYVLDNLEVRELEAISSDAPNGSPEFMKLLLFQNQNLHIGSWGLSETPQGDLIAVFRIRFSADATSKVLGEVIEAGLGVVQHTYEVLVPGMSQSMPKRVDLSGITPEEASLPNPKLSSRS